MEHTIETARVALEGELETILAQLKEHGEKNALGEWDASAINPDGIEPDEIDVADQIEELATNVPLVAQLDERMHDVQDALEKIKCGTYGTCEICHEAIAPERLIADPAARTCIAHAQ